MWAINALSNKVYIFSFLARYPYGLENQVGNYVGILVAFLATYLLPASAAVIATQDNLAMAMNPFRLFAINFRIGFKYSVL